MKSYSKVLLVLPFFSCLFANAKSNANDVSQTTFVIAETQKQLFDKFFALSDGDTTDINKKSFIAKEILSQDKNSRYFLYITSWASLILKRYDELDTYIKKIITTYPDFAEAHFLYGQYLNYTKQPGDVEEVQKCIEMNPKLSQPYFFLASNFETAKNYKLALTYYNLLEKADVNHKSLYYNRASVKTALADYPGAIEDYSKVLKIQPAHYRALFNRAMIYLQLENYISAEPDFTAFLQIMPTYALAYYYRANARYYLGKYVVACEDFKAAAKLGNKEAIAYLEKGCK